MFNYAMQETDMDDPPDRRTNDEPPMPSEAELREMMDRSDLDVAAGRTVSLDDVLATMERRIGVMEARLHAKQA